MRKGLNEIAYDKTVKLSSKVSDKITERLKGQKPFNMEKVDPDLLVWSVNNLGYEDLRELMQEYPPEQLNKLRYEAWKIEQRRNKDG